MQASTTIEQYRAELASLAEGIPDPLPPAVTALDPSVPHAPKCPMVLNDEEKELAIKNALRYFDPKFHAELAPEFAKELATYGHIYMYRLRPTKYTMYARPIGAYPTRTKYAACIALMIQNNLDPRVAQFPHELVIYGGNGRAFQNWAQYRLTMKYLCEMDENQCLIMYSGHPAGLFPTPAGAPRLVSTCGMVIPRPGSAPDAYDRLRALGCSMYGQMTAGSYCYIGPQGIVHGTTLVLLNAARKYLHIPSGDLHGKLFVTSGLGGMSGAQGKAGRISGVIAVIAEVNRTAAEKRLNQGWVDEIIEKTDTAKLFEKIHAARKEKKSVALAYHGNIVELLEALVKSKDPLDLPELISDQTSLHNPYNGGYYPVQCSFDEANQIMAKDPAKFKQMVNETLCRHVAALNELTSRGARFWDYGNSFLLQSSRAGAPVMKPGTTKFRYPSYVEDIMGDIFSLGFGPFRWVCTSGDPKDLEMTDKIAAEVVKKLSEEEGLPAPISQQYHDNYVWITQAGENHLVVGSQARILYSDAFGRAAIATEFNNAVHDGRLHAPVVISRDHHDVSGTDSPYRETSDVRDGSNICADMSIQNFVGDALRGATWVAIHNGGGVGWGESTNGGHGMVLDGEETTGLRARAMLSWDVNNGVNRRAWAGNANANLAIKRSMGKDSELRCTVQNKVVDPALIHAAVTAAFAQK